MNPYLLVFDPMMIYYKFQIWRLITCVFFFGKLGFPFLINLYFLYSYSVRLETELFERRPADYAVMLTTVGPIPLTLPPRRPPAVPWAAAPSLSSPLLLAPLKRTQLTQPCTNSGCCRRSLHPI